MSELIVSDKSIKHDPDWCDYEGAYTHGIMGCWSILYGRIKSEKDCIGCELHKEQPKGGDDD